MKSILGPGIVAALSLACALFASGQTQNALPTHPSTLPTPAHSEPLNPTYQYDFISPHYVWSNKPLRKTAGKICQTMKDHSFSETAYAINDDHDWNACLQTQIRSIGYMRWLRNDGFKPNSKNRKNAQAFLRKTYTMGHWGSYTFAELSKAVKETGGQQK